MQKLTITHLAFVMVTSLATSAFADQSIYIDQVSGDNLDLTIVQQSGDGNEIGQPLAQSPYWTLEGNDMSIDILQQGASNKVYGSIQGDSMTFDLDQVGDNNLFDFQIGSGSNSNYTLNIVGSSNLFDFNMGQSVSSEYHISTYNVIGDSNEFVINVESDGAQQTVDITGSGSEYTINQSGYGSSIDYHEVKITSVGSYNTVNVTQDTTLAASYLELNVNGDNQTINITQSD